MIHTSYWRPRVYPYNGDVTPAQIDRLQDITASITLNREKIREIGRDGTVSWRKRIPSTRVTLRQNEYGEIEFWQKLANMPSNDYEITLADFKTAMVDICGYKTDDSGTFEGTVWYPKLRTSGFGINIGDPQAMIERTFDLVGEDEIILQGDNQYFMYKKFTAVGGSNETFTVIPEPTLDPDVSGADGYFLRVLRVSGGTTTELTYTTDYTYNPTTYVLTVLSTTAADVIKVYYSSDDYLSGQTVFTNNDTDAGGISADCASIFLYVAADNYVYRLQSVGIDVSFDRSDYYEIGNKEVVSRGIRENTVRVTLGRMVEAYTIEEVLRGQVADYGKLNPREFGSANTLRVKVYGNNTKNTFNIGYKMTNLAPVTLDEGVPLNDYNTRTTTLEGEDLTISSVEATIDA